MRQKILVPIDQMNEIIIISENHVKNLINQ